MTLNSFKTAWPMGRLLATMVVLGGTATPAAAQDSVPPPDAVRIGIEYRPGTRPTVVVLPARGLDSVRAMVARDLDYSDRFDVIALGPADTGQAAGLGATPNYALFRTLGAEYGVELVPAGSAVRVRLHDMSAGAMRKEQLFALPGPSEGGFRMSTHHLSDEVVRWVTGTPGMAASQLLFVRNHRVYRVDSDGAGLAVLTGADEQALSPVWGPDGTRFAFTLFNAGRGSVVVQNLATGVRTTVPGTGRALNITPSFAADGRTVAYARADEEGTDIFRADAVSGCCVQRLTVGRYSDNLSPTFAPDGRRMAFVSTRAGQPQIYVMSADGTDQELLAPFDFGVTGASNAPEWSPDGASVAFHRDVNRMPQVFVLDVASRRVRQLTSAGRNEDPTWAPDGRHVAFVSDRSGQRQLWIIDMVTGRIRQLTYLGQVRLPAWSRLMAGPAATTN